MINIDLEQIFSHKKFLSSNRGRSFDLAVQQPCYDVIQQEPKAKTQVANERVLFMQRKIIKLTKENFGKPLKVSIHAVYRKSAVRRVKDNVVSARNVDS